MTQTQTYYPYVARTIVLTAKLKKKISNVFFPLNARSMKMIYGTQQWKGPEVWKTVSCFKHNQKCKLYFNKRIMSLFLKNKIKCLQLQGEFYLCYLYFKSLRFCEVILLVKGSVYTYRLFMLFPHCVEFLNYLCWFKRVLLEMHA